MSSVKNFIIRPPEKEDLTGVIELFNAYSLKVIGEKDEDAATLGMVWSSPGINMLEDFRVALDKKNSIAAYLEIIRDTRPMVPFLDLYVSPDYWNSSLGEELFAWGEKRILDLMDSKDVPADARYLIQAACYSEDSYYKGLLQSRGLTLERVQWRMEKGLDSPLSDTPPLPEGVEIKTARGMSDLSPILRIFREVWKDHWGYVEKPFDDHYSRWIHFWQGEGMFDPDLWFIAWKEDRIVGFSLCKGSHGGDDSLGWVQSRGSFGNTGL